MKEVLPPQYSESFARFPVRDLLLIIGLYLVYACVMIYHSSVVYDGRRWFCLLDDAMISMRYARNLAAGSGLVWNIGEQIEGITNPGWTFIMAGVHLVVKDRATTSLWVQLISALSITGTIWVTARISWVLSVGSKVLALVAALSVALYYPLNYWGLFGMETGLVGLLLIASVYSWFRAATRQRFPYFSYALAGCATLVRMDAVISLVVLGGYGILSSTGTRDQIRHMLWLLGTLVVFIGGQTLAREFYYGDHLPNTYYLKMTGFPVLQRMARGAYYTSGTVGILLFPLVLISGLAAVFSYKSIKASSNISLRKLGRGLRQQPVLLPALIFAAQVLYSIYVGGDAWEETIYCNRYIVVAYPLFAVVSIVILKAVYDHVIPFQNDTQSYRCGLILLLVGSFGFQVLNSVPVTQIPAFIHLQKPVVQSESLRTVELSQFIKKELQPNWVVSCDWAGGIPYFIDNYTVDPLGKCDAYIARLPATHVKSPIWYKAFYPGHMKWDADYTYEKYRPDFMIFLWGAGAGRDFKSILSEHYDQVDVRGMQAAAFKSLNSR